MCKRQKKLTKYIKPAENASNTSPEKQTKKTQALVPSEADSTSQPPKQGSHVEE